MVALARLLHHRRRGLHHFRRAGHSIGVTRAGLGFTCVTARAFARRGLRPFGIIPRAAAPLPAERAICRVTSFQVTRSARLSWRTENTKGEKVKGNPIVFRAFQFRAFRDSICF